MHHVATRSKPGENTNIPGRINSSRLAGFSIRHFRRIIEEDDIPIMQVGRKYFIVASNFEAWKESQGQKRVGACLQN